MAKLTLTDSNFQKEVLQSELPVLVDFTAEWCPPCRALKPLLQDLAGEYEGKLKVGELDVDSNMQSVASYQVQSMPTLLLFKGGKVASASVGFRPKSELVKMLQAAL